MFVKPYSPDRRWSADEYLAWESVQEFKNELIDNRVWLMLGAGLRHNTISINLMMTMHPTAEEKGFELLLSRMCLKVDPESTYVYPDLSLVQGEPQMSVRMNQHTFENPTVLFEILSPHTEAMDRGRKLDLYLQLDSLDAYFLVAQDKPLIEAHRRAGGEWRFSETAGLDSNLAIPALDCEIPLREVYRRVQFDHA
ncbi:MAG: Uma2 family endonuclease [Chloroflexota bacterium]|nr:Uma2 family endonuclease [Chloroflexota bacterium]